MSMILVLTTLSDASIDRILTTPALVWRIIAPDDPDIFADTLQGEGKQGFFARVFGKRRANPDNSDPTDLTVAKGECSTTDLEKAWHGIHFLLTGSAWGGAPPLNFLVGGGTQVGDIDVGYGPARAFRSTQVVEIREALERVHKDELQARYQPDAMTKMDIYPAIWDRDPKTDDALGYLLEYLAELNKFISDAADRGLGIFVTLQ